MVGKQGVPSPRRKTPATDRTWMDRAACRDDEDLFYPPDSTREGDESDSRETDQERADRVEIALAVCYSCPVRVECLAWARKTRQPAGIWGGVDVEQRTRRYRKKAAA